MKIPLPSSIVKVASKLFDIEATGESAKVDARSYEYGYVLSRLANIHARYDRRMKLLDIGCTARINPVPKFACELGWNITGIDIRKWNFEHGRFKMIVGNFLEHIFYEQFDIITAVSTIEHMGIAGRYGIREMVEDYDCKVVEKMDRILVSGGTLLITVPVGERCEVRDNMRIYKHDDIKWLKVFDRYAYSSEFVTVDNKQTMLIKVNK